MKIDRRALLGGTASLALVRPAAALPPQVQLPGRTPRQFNIQTPKTTLVSVATSTGLNGNQNTSASLLNCTGNPLSQQITYVAPAGAAITNLQIGIPGFMVESLNESLNTFTIQWKVAVEYPTSTTLMDVAWSGPTAVNGGAAVNVVPAHQTYWSDNCPVYIPAGSVYAIRMYGVIQGMSPPVFGITVSGNAISAVGALAISSMAFADNLVTVGTTLAHGLPVGITFPVTIAGVTPSGYNGSYTATVTGTSAFTFPLAGSSPGTVTVQGTYISYGQGLNTVPTLSVTSLGGTGGSVTPTFNFSVGARVIFTNNGAYNYTGSPLTVTTSGGGGSVQPTWQGQIKNNCVVAATQLTAGSPDFTSVPTFSFSGASGSAAAATATLAGGVMVGTPAFVAGSGYTNGTYVSTTLFTGGISMLPGSGNYSSGTGLYRTFYYQGSTAVDCTDNAAHDSGGAFSFSMFNPLIRAQLSTQLPCIGIVGTSIEYGYQDTHDYAGVLGYIAKSLAGDAVNGGTGGQTSGLPFINISRSSSTALALLGSGRGQLQALVDGGATHIICGHPRNDMNNGISAANCLTIMQRLWEVWLTAGLPVYATTILPFTTSTDNWATTGNQTQGTNSSIFLTWNTNLRANWASYGLAGIIDVAAFFDSGGSSSPTGLWTVTGQTGEGAGYLATISGGAVSAVTLATHTGGTPTNSLYLSSGTGTGNLQFWGGGGTGATGTFAVTAGVGGAATVTAGGSGYTTPPLVAAIGANTADGIHPSTYGYLSAVAAGLFAPSQFSL